MGKLESTDTSNSDAKHEHVDPGSAAIIRDNPSTFGSGHEPGNPPESKGLQPVNDGNAYTGYSPGQQKGEPVNDGNAYTGYGHKEHSGGHDAGLDKHELPSDAVDRSQAAREHSAKGTPSSNLDG